MPKSAADETCFYADDFSRVRIGNSAADASLGGEEVAVVDADASHFFEGAEKLLEIWFFNDDDDDEEEYSSNKQGAGVLQCGGSQRRTLRDIPREELVKMLEIARCKILHAKSNGYVDSYVLSESSMFISDSRFIIKTCGTTDLLRAIPRILSLAREYARMTAISNVYYSRKNFLRPHLQPHLHRGFDGEVDHLDAHFQDGGAYCMGSMKHDRWYLYTINSPQAAPLCADHSLEILMSDIPADVLKVYSTAECASGEECTKRGGISQLTPPGTEIHEELFEPVGYSMNGLIPDSDQYVTVHITPEKEFSFVSFETNQRRQCLYKQTLKVLDCFRPNRIIVIVFSNDLSANGKETQTRIWQNEIPGYRRVNLQFLRLQYDTLVYAQFTRDVDAAPNHRKMRRIIENTAFDDEDSNQSD